MENKLQLFSYQGQDIRVIWLEDLPYWVLVDVCKVLDIDQPTRVAERLDQKGVKKTHVLTAGGQQEMLCITEPNLYRTIFRSNKTEAVVFQDWVFEEVLPAIRKTGSYSINGDINFDGYGTIKHLDLENNPELLRQAIQLYEDLGLTIRDKRKMLIEIEKENFPGNTFTRGRRKTLDIGLYLRQVADRYQFGVKIVGEEIVIQRAFWGSDRAL